MAKKDPNWELCVIEKEMNVLIQAPQSNLIRERISTLQQQYQSYIAAQEAYWLQRLCLNWDLMGNHNTRFFHTTTMVRRRRNIIEAIQNEAGDWLGEEGKIRGVFVKHFRQIYQADTVLDVEGPNRILAGIVDEINPISHDLASMLYTEPDLAEISWAVQALGPTKLPGPDGITAGLVQQQWEHLGPVVIVKVEEFFETGRMKPHTAHSNLVLIPKIDTPLKVTDYRSISICNFLYKVISKLLAKRMQFLMDAIISKAQTAFAPDREISNNVILLREIIHSFKRPLRNQQQFVLKANLAKAFDRVS